MTRIRNWFDDHPLIKGLICFLWGALSIAAIVLAQSQGNTVLFYGGIVALLACVFRPGSALHKPTMEKWNFGKFLICILVLAATVFA